MYFQQTNMNLRGPIVYKLSFPAFKGWVALSSLFCLSFVVVVRTSRMVTSPLYDVLDHTNHTFSESYWSKDIKTDITKCLMHKYTNTNTQIHKYSIWRSARKTQHVVYFWKEDCSRISKIIFPCVERTNTKIQIHKYTNTQIQHMTKCQKDPTCGIFLKRGLFKDIKNDIPMCRTHKYKNTKTQIHKYSIWRSARKTQHVVYYWKEDCSRILKIIIPCAERAKTKIQNTQIHKYTNTAYDEVPERPNMWYIFEERIVQR